jgi:YD repeat-containing protein
MTREDGSVLTYAYDSRDAGRLVSVSVSALPSEDNPPLAGTTAQTFTYDGPGHRLASTDNNDPSTNADDADCAWRYDSLGRTIEESQQLGATGTLAVVSYHYTANDRAALVYPNGRTVDQTYHYPGGPLRTILDDGASSAIAQYEYLGGRTLVRAMQNGVNLDLRGSGGAAFFDATGRPTQWLHRDTNQTGSPTKIGFEYAYDGNGNKQYQKSVHDPLDSQRYAYDSADRLTACVRGPFGTLPEGFCGPSTGTWSGMDQYEGWNLDGLGNWSEYTTRKAGPTTATATTVERRTDDTFNAYARVGEDANGQGGVAQTHDLNGNLTDDGKKILKWDAMNRLREVWTTTGTLVAKYTYDTVGRRLQKTVQPGFPGESAVSRFADWRILEDCTTATPPVPKRQYTYGNYLDEVLTMDTDLTTNGLCRQKGQT